MKLDVMFQRDYSGDGVIEECEGSLHELWVALKYCLPKDDTNIVSVKITNSESGKVYYDGPLTADLMINAMEDSDKEFVLFTDFDPELTFDILQGESYNLPAIIEYDEYGNEYGGKYYNDSYFYKVGVEARIEGQFYCFCVLIHCCEEELDEMPSEDEIIGRITDCFLMFRQDEDLMFIVYPNDDEEFNWAG